MACGALSGSRSAGHTPRLVDFQLPWRSREPGKKCHKKTARLQERELHCTLYSPFVFARTQVSARRLRHRRTPCAAHTRRLTSLPCFPVLSTHRLPHSPLNCSVSLARRAARLMAGPLPPLPPGAVGAEVPAGGVAVSSLAHLVSVTNDPGGPSLFDSLTDALAYFSEHALGVPPLAPGVLPEVSSADFERYLRSLASTWPAFVAAREARRAQEEARGGGSRGAWRRARRSAESV